MRVERGSDEEGSEKVRGTDKRRLKGRIGELRNSKKVNDRVHETIKRRMGKETEKI